MERRKSPLGDENKHRRNTAEKPSDTQPEKRLAALRNQHAVGFGLNPRELRDQRAGTNEASSSGSDRQHTTHHDTPNSLKHETDRNPSQDEKKLAQRETGEEQAITTSSDEDSDLFSTQNRKGKRQLSPKEVELLRKWLKARPLDEHGHCAPKTVELTSVPTPDKPILVGGMMKGTTLKDLMKFSFREKGESSHSDQRSEVGNQRSEADKWINKKLGNYKLIEYLREEEDRNHGISLVYRGEHVHSKKLVEVKVPKEASKWINKKLGNYKLTEYLREDSISLVYRGEHVSSKEPVEIKVLKKKYKNNSEIVEQFLKEVETLRSLNHPHIVRGLESRRAAKITNKVDHLVMGDAQGTLHDAYPQDEDSRWSREKVVTMVNDLADALDYLHNYKDDKKSKLLIYRNLNPRTVLLGAYGQFLLSSFRRVKEVGDQSKAEGYLPRYVAPELSSKKGREIGPVSDQYSLAIMAYELLTGNEHPFSGLMHQPETKPLSLVGKIQGVSEQVQENIQKVIFKALEYDPNKRYDNVKIFAEELEKACFGHIRRQRPPRERLQKLHQEIADCDEAISRNPGNVEAHYKKGKALSEIGHNEEAEIAYHQVISLNPEPKHAANVYYQLGDTYSNLERKEEAVAAYYEAVTAFDETIRINKASLDRARYTVDHGEAMHIKQELAEDYFNMGNALYKLGDSRRAETAFRKAINLNPKHVEAHLNMGNALYNQNDLSKALTAYEKVIGLILNSNTEGQQSYSVQIGYDGRIHNSELYIEAYYKKGKVLSELGNHQRAAAAFSEANRVNPKYVEAHDQEWNADLNRNAETAASDASRHPETVETNIPRVEEAETSLNLEHPRAHYRRGQELAEQGDYQEAVNVFSEAINLNPNHADAYYQRGNAFSKLGDYQKATADYEQATRLNPQHADAYYQMGNALAGQRDYQGAAEAYGRYISLNPQHADAYYQRGNALAGQGDHQGAAKAFRKATNLDSRA